jgi:hypothetical protein
MSMFDSSSRRILQDSLHTENQLKYTQFQSVGIKDKLNTRTLQLAQLTPPW